MPERPATWLKAALGWPEVYALMPENNSRRQAVTISDSATRARRRHHRAETSCSTNAGAGRRDDARPNRVRRARPGLPARGLLAASRANGARSRGTRAAWQTPAKYYGSCIRDSSLTTRALSPDRFSRCAKGDSSTWPLKFPRGRQRCWKGREARRNENGGKGVRSNPRDLT